MKKILFASLIFATCAATVHADEIKITVPVNHFSIERDGTFLTVDMDIDLSAVDVKSKEALLITPHLVNNDKMADLPSVAIYGRNRYYHYLRNTNGNMLSGAGEMTFQANDKPNAINYHQLIPYEEWMDGAAVVMDVTDYGCCRHVLAQEFTEVGQYFGAFFPELVFVQPTAEIDKHRSIEGQAFIDFPVDQTVIYPDYRRNSIELDSIRATIDVVRNDPDATIDTVWLKGFASPESPYAHNTDLAKGRTAALKRYINNIYNFKDVVILTDYEPEDWEGLRKSVEKSNLAHRTEILKLIDTKMDPDAKELRIKQLYPEDYRFMLQEFYPALRHTNYRVSYVVRTFYDPAEILKLVHTQPRKLSQNEFYVAASILEPGSEEFSEVFETAVRMYPTDPVANLNAANAALRREDNAAAERYLAKAGNSAEAIYARAALEIRKKNYDAAVPLLEQAEKAGCAQARITLDSLKKRTK